MKYSSVYLRFIFVLCMFSFLSNASAQCLPDSLNMRLASHWDDDALPTNGTLAYNDIWGYVDPNGNEYAIIGNVDTVFIFDVTDPDNIVKVGGIKGTSSCTWRDFKTYDHYLYASSDNCSEGLLIFDLSLLPASFSLVYSSTEHFINAHNIYIEDEGVDDARLYVVGANSSSGAREGMIILDIDVDPENPVLLKKLNLDTLPGEDPAKNYYIHDLYVKNDTVYASHGYYGYAVWDVKDVEGIYKIGAYEMLPNSGDLSYVHSSWNTPDNRYAYVATEIGNRQMYVIDHQDDFFGFEIDTTWKEPLLNCPDLPDEDGPENNVPHNPYYVSGYLFISYYQDGVQVLDVTDPLVPTRAAYYDTNDNTVYNGTRGNWGVYPFLPSGTIVASDTQNGLFVLRLTAPLLPLDLLSFSVKPEKNMDKTSRLIWSVANVKQVEKFDIERSSDGIQFEKIDEVAYLEDIFDYDYVDRLANDGINYYRLKIIDYDGKFEYSPTKSIRFSESEGMTVHPNPSNGLFEINCTKPSRYSVEVYSTNGQILDQISYPLTDHLSLDLTQYTKGMYLLKVQNIANYWWEKILID